MPSNTPVSGLPYALLTDSPNANTLSQSSMTALDHLVIPKYATTAARTSANGTPTNNDICSVTSTDEIYYYNGSVWVGLTPRFYYASSSTTVTSSVTLVSVNGMGSIPYEANSIYVIESFLWLSASTSLVPGWKTNLHTSTTDTAGRFNFQGSLGGTAAGDNALNNSAGGFTSGNLQVTLASMVNGSMLLKGTLVTTTAGTLSMQFAQFSSNSNGITVGANSYLSIQKIG